jgi:hypothetical protein
MNLEGTGAELPLEGVVSDFGVVDDSRSEAKIPLRMAVPRVPDRDD